MSQVSESTDASPISPEQAEANAAIPATATEKPLTPEEVEKLRRDITHTVTEICRKVPYSIEGLPAAGNAEQFAANIADLSTKELLRVKKILRNSLVEAPRS